MIFLKCLLAALLIGVGFKQLAKGCSPNVTPLDLAWFFKLVGITLLIAGFILAFRLLKFFSPAF